MNKRQKTLLWCGVIIILIMGLYPPWYAKNGTYRYSYGYDFISDIEGRIDVTRLVLQWLIVTIATTGLFFASGRTMSKNAKKTLKIIGGIIILSMLIMMASTGNKENPKTHSSPTYENNSTARRSGRIRSRNNSRERRRRTRSRSRKF